MLSYHHRNGSHSRNCAQRTRSYLEPVRLIKRRDVDMFHILPWIYFNMSTVYARFGHEVLSVIDRLSSAPTSTLFTITDTG
jgi:hypothetical protein